MKSIRKLITIFRTEYISQGIIALGTLTSVAGVSLITGCKNETDEGVSPAENLMREYGQLHNYNALVVLGGSLACYILKFI